MIGGLIRHADSAHGSEVSAYPREMRAKLGENAMALRLQRHLIMKKTTRKLALRTETIRSLTHEALTDVVGGFLMKDTIIIRTGNPVVAGPSDGCR